METATSTSCKKIFDMCCYYTRQGLWWMQGGAPAHCTTAAKVFPLNKFECRVISSGTQIAWPAHFLDLNPLDFYYWALAQKEMYTVKPTTVNEIINVVKRVSEAHRDNVLHSVALTVLKRSNLCLLQNGGHFQHLL